MMFSEAIRVPFDRMPGFSRLYNTYCSDYERLAGFYAGDWRSPKARQTVAASVDKRVHPLHRDTLAGVLEYQNKQWGDYPDAQQQHVEALRNGGALAVVTGQQVGIFSGPLYTLYKAFTAVILARHLQQEIGRSVVPIFWLEGGDHDLEEVSQTRILQSGTLLDMRYSGHTLPKKGNLGSVGKLRFTRDIVRVAEEITQALPPTEFIETAVQQWFVPYQHGVTFTDAFAQTLSQIFADTGLLLLDPDDQTLKRLTVPLFCKEIQEHALSNAQMEEASRHLEVTYHAQVHPKATNLFFTGGKGRQAILPDGDDFVLRDSGERVSKDTLLEWIASSPHLFSPNVALRPLMQDTLLPTVAYVAGPGEVSYFAQLKGLYAWAGVPMPIIYPRASVTIVESRMQKTLSKMDLSVADMGDDLERVFQRVVLEQSGTDAMFAAATESIHRTMQTLQRGVEEVEVTLGQSTEATGVRLVKELDKLKSRVLKAEKRKHETLRATLEKVRGNLYPGGKLQERTLSAVYFLSKYGPDFWSMIESQLSLDTAEHQVFVL